MGQRYAYLNEGCDWWVSLLGLVDSQEQGCYWIPWQIHRMLLKVKKIK
jgi:hypothetical protein